MIKHIKIRSCSQESLISCFMEIALIPLASLDYVREIKIGSALSWFTGEAAFSV
jgi:hypothetical protein